MRTRQPSSLWECPECKAQQPEPGRCGRCPGVVLPVATPSLFVHGRWDEGPCYICSKSVTPSEGWHREDHDGKRRHWCKAHRPAWSWGERECIQHGYDYSTYALVFNGEQPELEDFGEV